MDTYEGFIVCPEKNDAHLQLVLSKDALSALIKNLIKDHPLEEETKEAPKEQDELESCVFKGNVLKLLLMQLNSGQTTFDKVIAANERQMLMSYLIKEGEGAVELFSKQIQALKSPSEAMAARQSASYLELLLNYYFT